MDWHYPWRKERQEQWFNSRKRVLFLRARVWHVRALFAYSTDRLGTIIRRSDTGQVSTSTEEHSQTVRVKSDTTLEILITKSIKVKWVYISSSRPNSNRIHRFRIKLGLSYKSGLYILLEFDLEVEISSENLIFMHFVTLQLHYDCLIYFAIRPAFWLQVDCLLWLLVSALGPSSWLGQLMVLLWRALHRVRLSSFFDCT